MNSRLLNANRKPPTSSCHTSNTLKEKKGGEPRQNIVFSPPASRVPCLFQVLVCCRHLVTRTERHGHTTLYSPTTCTTPTHRVEQPGGCSAYPTDQSLLVHLSHSPSQRDARRTAGIQPARPPRRISASRSCTQSVTRLTT
jgi:hypothetical protein